MKSASTFLMALGRCLSSMGLYVAGHPAREHAAEAAYEKLLRLQESTPRCVFTLIDDQVMLGNELLHSLDAWDWGRRLAQSGIQRIDITGSVAREEFLLFLDEAIQRVSGTPMDTAETRSTRVGAIRFGLIGLTDKSSETARQATRILTARLPYSLRDEAAAVRWMHDEVAGAARLPLFEAEAVVRSLSVAMHGDNQAVLPLLQLKEFDQYTTTHSLNVSVLTMALAETLGYGAVEVRAFGVAGLLHDLGKVCISKELLNKPGALTSEERLEIQRHPAEGARIILEGDRPLDLAAIVAYEHHIMLNGCGYPTIQLKRECHHASHMVHVCDVYDALRTRRPYREAWEADQILSYIADRAGTEFEPAVARAFLGMMRQWEQRVAMLQDEPVVTHGAVGAA